MCDGYVNLYSGEFGFKDLKHSMGGCLVRQL
jgi:hypothetical protein